MPSRRQQIQLSAPEIDEFLRSQKTIVIVSNGKDGFPHPMPMWFHADEAGAIYCTTFSRSQKVLNFERDPRAALLVETGEVYEELKSVLIYASAEVVRDRGRVIDTLVKINTRGRRADPQEIEQLSAAVARTAEKRVVLKFTPARYVSWDHAKLGGGY